MIDLLVFTIVLVGLVVGSYTDFKKREVPDWVSFALIFSGFGLRLIFSLLENNWWYLLYGVIGFTVFYGIGLVMYYTGQWGGGDSKVIMGLGALLGLELSINSFLVSFFLNMLIVGAVYGLLWSLIAALVNFRDFFAELRRVVKEKSFVLYHRIILVICFLLVIIVLFIDDNILKISIMIFALLIITSVYLFVFVRSVENACMKKYVDVKELTEGDWIVDDIFVRGKKIVGPKDLGIEREQIDYLLKNYKKKVLIKVGIPFVPSFLFSFIVTVIFGNLFMLFL